MRPKRALCIHDMSAIGRCSLSVIGPVLATMGVQPVTLPTAVLSSHFGGFGPVAMTDLSDFCNDALGHYERIGEKFDCVYSGFLSSPAQIDMVKRAFLLADDGFKLCDPAMADHGKLYSSVTVELTEKFRDLCGHSDLIIPNPTEALILLDKDYTKADLFDPEEAAEIARQLGEEYCDTIITGMKLSDGRTVCAGYIKYLRKSFNVELDYLPVSYPGTGDLFGGCIAGFILSGDDLVMACKKSAEFVRECVRATYRSGEETKYGVWLEPMLKKLIKMQED